MKSEHGGIGTAAVEDVAGVYSETARAHRDDQVTQAAERLAYGGHAGQQGLMREQWAKRDRRRVE